MNILPTVISCVVFFDFTFAENPCLIGVPRTDGSWPQYHDRYLEAVAQDTDDQVVWIGDSIVERMINSTLWTTKISQLRAINLGIGGDKVENVLWRMENGEFDFKIPIKAAVIFVGTNNIGTNTPSDIAEGIMNLAVVAKQKLGDDTAVVLPTMLPKGHNPGQTWDDLFEVNRLIYQYFSNNPMEQVYIVLIGEDAIQPDGTISSDDFSDFTHPTDQGYTKFFTAVYDLLVTIV